MRANERPRVDFGAFPECRECVNETGHGGALVPWTSPAGKRLAACTRCGKRYEGLLGVVERAEAAARKFRDALGRDPELPEGLR